MSVFPDRQPTLDELKEKLGSSFPIWNDIKQLIIENYLSVSEEWFTSGKKYGWSFRMISKKRRIVYFQPREEYFYVAFIYGQKATDAALASGGKLFFSLTEVSTIRPSVSPITLPGYFQNP